MSRALTTAEAKEMRSISGKTKAVRSAERQRIARSLYENGSSVQEIAGILKLKERMIYRYLDGILKDKRRKAVDKNC